MIDKNKIELVRQKIRGNLKIDPMFVGNEPVHSGVPENTIQKDVDETDENK